MSSSDASSRLHDKSPLRRKTEQLVIRWITGAAALLARVLPLRSLQALGNAMGSLLFRLLKPRREIALANLERVFGDRYDRRERERIINFSVRNMAKTMLELLKDMPEILFEPDNADSLTHVLRGQIANPLSLTLKAPSWMDLGKQLENFFSLIKKER